MTPLPGSEYLAGDSGVTLSDSDSVSWAVTGCRCLSCIQLPTLQLGCWRGESRSPPPHTLPRAAEGSPWLEREVLAGLPGPPQFVKTRGGEQEPGGSRVGGVGAVVPRSDPRPSGLGSAPPGEGQRGRIAAPGASHAPPAGRGYKERRGRRRRSAAARSGGAAGTGQRERNGVAGAARTTLVPPTHLTPGVHLAPRAETRELIALFAPPRRWEPGPGWDPGSSPGRPRPAEDLLLEWGGCGTGGYQAPQPPGV